MCWISGLYFLWQSWCLVHWDYRLAIWSSTRPKRSKFIILKWVLVPGIYFNCNCNYLVIFLLLQQLFFSSHFIVLRIFMTFLKTKILIETHLCVVYDFEKNLNLALFWLNVVAENFQTWQPWGTGRKQVKNIDQSLVLVNRLQEVSTSKEPSKGFFRWNCDVIFRVQRRPCHGWRALTTGMGHQIRSQDWTIVSDNVTS